MPVRILNFIIQDTLKKTIYFTEISDFLIGSGQEILPYAVPCEGSWQHNSLPFLRWL